MKNYIIPLSLILLFASCQKSGSNANVTSAVHKDTVAPAAQVIQTANADKPYTDTFYGNWTQSPVPYHTNNYNGPHGNVYLSYPAQGKILIFSDFFGEGSRSVFTGLRDINDSGEYFLNTPYGDATDYYQFKIKNDSLICHFDQSDGACLGNDYPGTYAAHRTSTGPR